MIAAGLALYSEDDPHRVKFKHALLRDAAYNTLLRTARRAYHRRIADGYVEWDENVSSDVLAFHLHEAGDFAAAVPHWVAAAQANLASNSLFEAAKHLALAIECVRELEPTVEVKTQELELQSQIWPLWAATEGWGSNNVEAACERGLELATELERYDLLYVPLWGLWTVYFLRGEMGQALTTAHQVHQMAQASGVPMLQVTGEHALSYTHVYRGELDDALASAERGLALFDLDQERAIADTFQLSSTVALLGIRAMVNYLQGRVTSAENDWKELVDLARDLDHPPSLAAGLAFTLQGRSLQYPAYGRLDRMEPVLDELLTLTADEGSLLWQAVANCFAAAVTADDKEAADRRIATAWEVFSYTGSQLTEVLTRVVFAEARLRLDDLDGASGELDRAEIAMREREEGLLGPDIWRLRGRIAAIRGQTHAAKEAFDAAVDLAARQNAPMLRMRALLDRIETKVDESRSWLVDAIAGVLGDLPDSDGEPDVAAARRVLADART
jgi:tetratricopeptide (TPR) repeat protein